MSERFAAQRSIQQLSPSSRLKKGEKGRETHLRFEPTSQMQASQYIPLLTLALDWATSGGEPAPMVVSRICDWAISGGFPENTFMLSNGREVPVLQLYRASSSVFLGVTSGMAAGTDSELLQSTLVRRTGVLTFCSSLKVAPPPSVRTLRSSFSAILHRFPFRTPPSCPQAQVCAKQADAREGLQGTLPQLRELIVDAQALQGAPPEHAAHFLKRCSTNFELAASYASAANNPDLQREFADLEASWQAIRTSASKDSPQAEQESSSEGAPRGIGRPLGSGFQAQDEPLLEKMKKRIEETGVSVASAANYFADQAAGSSTWESKTKRLQRAYRKLYS
jgi:hypothetical protein